MSIKTFGDLKKHLNTLDLEPMAKRLGTWLDGQLRSMPGDVAGLHLEWDLVGGEVNDEIVADLFGYKPPGLDPTSPGDWDWSSGDAQQFQFIGLGAVWSEAVEILIDDQVPAAEEAISATIDAVVRRALACSQELARRTAAGTAVRFHCSKSGEPLREFGANGSGDA
ncbi:MAG: hypothetical protein HY303_16110 [Candidatus Wallbacteria bacterium]|nr:hypothetical protein [Candidatus Wallbacteria bacterium]